MPQTLVANRDSESAVLHECKTLEKDYKIAAAGEGRLGRKERIRRTNMAHTFMDFFYEVRCWDTFNCMHTTTYSVSANAVTHQLYNCTTFIVTVSIFTTTKQTLVETLVSFPP